jgi:hypothetical protein
VHHTVSGCCVVRNGPLRACFVIGVMAWLPILLLEFADHDDNSVREC